MLEIHPYRELIEHKTKKIDIPESEWSEYRKEFEREMASLARIEFVKAAKKKKGLMW